MRSRTDGAPSLPIVSDDDMTREELDQALQAGAITPDMHRAAVASLSAGSAAPSAGPASRYPGPLVMADGPEAVSAWFRDFDAHWAKEREKRQAAKERQAMGVPQTEGYEERVGIRPPSRLEQEGQDLADSRAYGTRSQGGAPFRSQAEAEEYGRRRVASPARRAEMAAQGMTEAEIIDAQRSQRDRDMAQSGRSGSSGWAPVYVDGRVTYMERAPDGPVGLKQEIAPMPDIQPAPSPRTTWSMLGTFPPRTPPAPRPSDATRTVVKTDRGATNIASGNRRSGPLVDSGEFSDSLGVPGNITPPVPVGTDRTDLRRRGYVQRTMDGPYGPERVWVKEQLGDETRARMLLEGDKEGLGLTLEEYQARQKERSLRRRLMDRAGISSTEAADMSIDQIRQLGSDNRSASERQRIANNRRARMAPRFRNELAFQEMGGPDSNEWQNAVAAQNLAPGLRGMTPTARDAMNMQQAFALANAALRGGGDDALGMRREMAAEDKKIKGRQIVASHMNAYWGGTAADRRAAADAALYAAGYDPAEREQLLADMPMTTPAAAPPSAGPNPTPRPGGGRDMF